MADSPPGPLVGWVLRRWRTPHPCATCGRMVRRGTVHVNDKRDPPSHTMCTRCKEDLMTNPEAFERRVDARNN